MAKNNTKGQPGSYKVGKGRPPVATRWKPGQSGNPRGRPPGSKNLDTILGEALNEKIPVQEKGRLRSRTAREVIGRRVVHAAMKGDLKAINLLLAHDAKHKHGITDQAPASADYYDDYDDRALDSLTPNERAARAQQEYLRLVRGVKV
jgi:Family of unknown function (DUF5681)